MTKLSIVGGGLSGLVAAITAAERGIEVGAVDLPGHTWRDRPQIEQGNGVFLAGDWVAAPGLLSEVAFSSAVTAVEKVVDLLRSQSGRRGAAPAGQAFEPR